MDEKKLKKFKEKHGGYNPYELKIHQRGYLMGIISILILIVFIFLIGGLILVSAETIYAGESKTFTLDETPDKCEFFGNTYNLDGIGYVINGKQVTVTVDPNFKADNITLKCFIGENEPVWYSFGSGGSSSSSTTITEENGTEEVVDETIEEETIGIEEVDKEISIWYFIISGFIIALIGITIYKLLKNKDKNQEITDIVPELVTDNKG